MEELNINNYTCVSNQAVFFSLLQKQRLNYFLYVLKSNKHDFRLYLRKDKSFLRKSIRDRKLSPIAVTMNHHHKSQLFLRQALFWSKMDCSSALNPLTTAKRSYHKICGLRDANDTASRLRNF